MTAIVLAAMIWRGVRAIEQEMAFVNLPGGCFLMGSPDTEMDRLKDEGPQRQVCLKPFALGRFTVTQGEWSQVMWLIGNPSANKNDNRLPVEMVSSDEAKHFVFLMNFFGKHRYALPTESQSKYAARAGTKTSRFWGEGFEAACLYSNMADRSYVKVWSSNATSLIAAACDDGFARTAPIVLLQA